MSFLKARDSINLQDDNSEQNDRINIYLRVKKTENIEDLYKINNNEISCCMPGVSNSKCTNMETITKKYTFSHIFGPNSTQEEIFNLIVKPKILQFINGKSTTLMSYGASGSGKTFTIIGTAAEPGIIPRTLEYLFKTLPKVEEIPLLMPTGSGNIEILSQTCRKEKLKARNDLLSSFTSIGENHIITYKKMKTRLSDQVGGLLENKQGVILNVWISFAEIYNENIYDLLIPEEKCRTGAKRKLQLASINENTFINNLTTLNISSAIQAYQILQYGLDNLSYAKTSVNAHSSRSHSIFTIKLAQMIEEGDGFSLSYFNFCDLAGSERLKKTLNVDARLKESNNINTSLFVLGRCIKSIRESQKKKIKQPIPFRESKLTRLFQKGLSGQEAFNMIVNMNASSDMYEESQHVLNFSAIAKDIVVKYTLPIQEESFFSKCPQANSTGCEETQQRKSKKSEIVEKLETRVIDLSDKLEASVQRLIIEEDRVRDEMNDKYAIIINNLRERYQKELMSERNRHQKELQMINAKSLQNDDEIIVISSSDEEEKEELEDPLILENLQLELELKNEKINELEKILEDSVRFQNELKEMYEIKLQDELSKNIILKEKIDQLEACISNNRIRMDI